MNADSAKHLAVAAASSISISWKQEREQSPRFVEGTLKGSPQARNGNPTALTDQSTREDTDARSILK